MSISAKDVKDLRERTGAGMMDCKKVLEEVAGDIDKAVDLLREKGLSKAAKKAGRIVAEGLVSLKVSEDKKKASIVEVNSETDFVAKNEEFIDFVSKLSEMVLNNNPKDIDELIKSKYIDSDSSVEEVLKEKIARIGENMSIRRFEFVEQATGGVFEYVHGLGKIGVLVSLKSDANLDEIAGLGKDIAMQVASMSPKYISSEDVDAEYIEHEKQILLNQAINENEEEEAKGGKKKPVDIIERMVNGRLQKELKEVCLLEQSFVKDSDFSVKQIIDNKAKELGKTIEVTNVVRFEVGEGMEKKSEDFREEVEKQMQNK